MNKRHDGAHMSVVFSTYHSIDTNRHHWEDWANDIAKIARTHIDRIQGILENPANTKEIAAFNEFAAELRDDLNGSISDGEIVEMLAQHLITKPVFDALFADYRRGPY